MAWRAERAYRAAKATHKVAAQAWNAAWRKANFKSAGEVGEVVGWGTNRTATADTLKRISQIDEAAVANMRSQGLTREVAEAAKKLYDAAVKVDKGDTVAQARARLMQKILENW